VSEGAFKARVAPVTAKTRKGEVVVDKDGNALHARHRQDPTLKPAFKKDGTVTAASSSGISDGAAAVVLGARVLCGVQKFAALGENHGIRQFCARAGMVHAGARGCHAKLLTQLQLVAQGR